MKFDIEVPFENLSRKFKFYQNITRITGTLHGEQSTFIIKCRSVLLGMKNVVDKMYRKSKQNLY